MLLPLLSGIALAMIGCRRARQGCEAETAWSGAHLRSDWLVKWNARLMHFQALTLLRNSYKQNNTAFPSYDSFLIVAVVNFVDFSANQDMVHDALTTWRILLFIMTTSTVL